MRSFLVEKFDLGNSSFYSDLGVYESGAGFYIGTMYYDPEEGFPQPGSRESMEYYGTREEAEQAFEKGTWTQRSHP